MSKTTDYKSTLRLPQTDFPMKANLPRREPEMLKHWEDIRLYETLLARRKAGTLSPKETREYEAICALDTTLSWLNRLARGARPH